MSLRDLVANECAEPNPLARFVSNMAGEKHDIFQDQWVDRDGLSTGDTQSRFRNRDELEQFSDEEDEDAFFNKMNNIAGPPAQWNTNEYLEDLRRDPTVDMPPPPSSADHALSTVLKSFIAGAHTKNVLGRFEDFPDIGLSDRDKAKIRDRAGIMSRHFYANDSQDFANEQMGALLQSLRITHHEENFRELEDSWRDATAHTHQRRAAEWEREYTRDRKLQLHNEMDDYEEMIKNTTANKSWLEENSHYASPDQWAAEYERGEARQWVRDYAKSDSQIEEETLEAAWSDAAHDRLMEAAWGEGQREVRRTGGQSLTELTDAITRIDDPKLQASNFMQFMHKINRGQVSFEDNRVIDRSDSLPHVDTGIIDDWLQEYDAGEREEDYAFNDPREWAREYEGFTGSIAPERLAEYEFVVNNAANPYSTHEDPFTAGKELFDQGHITEAILALEAEVHRNPMNSVAWQYLGQAHAENDKDGQAIISLEKAVEVDPQNLDALAALAVSYTNDFNREKALDVLETWLRRNSAYSHIPPPASAREEHADFYADAWGRHGKVADMYLEAAQMRPHDPDPEVQTALGLLYNLSYEYERAVDCFKAALTKRPSDYRLWNKLGATLANSNRSDEALSAYFKALEGKPTYVRARANLGISFLALNYYQEAAQSFLSALRLHPNATHLWDNLKMVFRLMGRDDLEERAARNDVDAFSDEFQY